MEQMTHRRRTAAERGRMSGRRCRRANRGLLRRRASFRGPGMIVWLLVATLLAQVETARTLAPHFPAAQPATAHAAAATSHAGERHPDGSGQRPADRHDGTRHDCSVCQALQHGLALNLPPGGAPLAAPSPSILPSSTPSDRAHAFRLAAVGGARAPPSGS